MKIHAGCDGELINTGATSLEYAVVNIYKCAKCHAEIDASEYEEIEDAPA